MTEYTEGQIVSHRILTSRLGFEHVQVSRHHGASALHRATTCGSIRYVQVHSGFEAGDTSWYPTDDGREWAAGFLTRHARQGYRVCKKCLVWADRVLASVPASTTGSEQP